MSGTRQSLSSLVTTSLLVRGGDGVSRFLVELEGRAPVLSVGDVQSVAWRPPPGRIVIVGRGLRGAVISGSSVREVVVILTGLTTTMTTTVATTVATTVTPVTPACAPDS